jgi:hypothetical protein
MNTTQLRALEAFIKATPECDPYVVTNDMEPVPGSAVVLKDDAIASIVMSEMDTVKRSLTVQEVFDVLFETGDYLSIKTAQLAGDPAASLCFSVLEDAVKLGPGKVNLEAGATVMLFQQLVTAGHLSAAGVEALHALATEQRPAALRLFGQVVTAKEVSQALRGPWGDE